MIKVELLVAKIHPTPLALETPNKNISKNLLQPNLKLLEFFYWG